MNASRIHSVIAAALADPGLLDRWQREPEALRRYGVDPERLDLASLHKFSGLALKIRHNGLRADFPLTFRLLSVSGLEIDLFAAYASHLAAQGQASSRSVERKADDLLAFLETWRSSGGLHHALLYDVLRHERALMHLSRCQPAIDDGATSAPGCAAPRPGAVPRIRGMVVLHEMGCDPRDLAATLRTRSPRLEEVALSPVHLCYWRSPAELAIHVLELDELGFFLLSAANGTRTVADLGHALGAGRRASAPLLDALARLGELGVLGFHEPP
jgi:hypothetical protein